MIKMSDSYDKAVAYTYVNHRKHSLGNIESMSPIVIGDWSIIFLYAACPPAKRLDRIWQMVIRNLCQAQI